MKGFDQERRVALFEPALLAVFAASGCSGLIYQSVWTSYLGNFLGHAAYAQSLVLAIFMGGLALGAWWAGRRADSARDPLRGYAVVEAAIGVFGLLFHALFVAASAWTFDAVLPKLGTPGAVFAFKWSLGTLLILPQAALLGMTFPLLSTGVMRRAPGRHGAVLAGLYFANSAGAAFGALVATFWLAPRYGLPGAMRVAGVLNLAVAAVAWLLAAQRQAVQARAEPRSESNAAPAFVLVAAALTGLSSFVYEIGWVRMLSLVLGSSIHAFELMLAAFIGGLALGGVAIRRRIDRLENAWRAAGRVQILMGLAALASLALYNGAFDWIGWLMRALSRDPSAYTLFNIGSSAIAVAIMVPAAFFAGMTLPLFTLALLRAGGGERAVGMVYAANTLGAIAGVFLAMHLLVPGVGLMLAMTAAAAIDLVLGCAILRSAAAAPRPLTFVLASALTLAALALTLRNVQFDPLRLASGVYRSGAAQLDAANRVMYLRDGKTATVAFVVTPQGVGALSTNGKTDAALALDQRYAPNGDEYTGALLALLPLALHDKPAHAAVIGFGSGLTTHTLLGDPRVERVDTIEIEPAMVEGARRYGPLVARAFADPRGKLYFDDAKTFLASSNERYDVIVSEPSNPWVNGVAGLFSEEFYRFVPRKLEDGGLFVQWLQGYEIDVPMVASVFKALAGNFAHFDVYEANSSDFVIVASPTRELPQPRGGVLQGQALHALAQRLGLGGDADLRVRWIGNERTIGALARIYPTRANSDYYPVLAYGAPATRFIGADAKLVGTLARWSLAPRGKNDAGWPAAAMLGSASSATAERILGADEVVRALRAPGTVPLVRAPSTLLGPIAALTTTRPPCGDTRELIGIALDNLTEWLVPFVPPERQHDVWSGPAFDCARADPVLSMRLALFEALGTQNHARALELAEAVLQGRADPAFAPYALQAAMASAIALGRNDAALKLGEQYTTPLELEQSDGFGVKVLTELARGR